MVWEEVDSTSACIGAGSSVDVASMGAPWVLVWQLRSEARLGVPMVEVQRLQQI